MKEDTQENKHLIASDVLGLIKLISAYQVEKAMKQYYHPEYHANENYEGLRIGIEKTVAQIQGEPYNMKALYYLKTLFWISNDSHSVIQWKCELQDDEDNYWYAGEVNIASWQHRNIVNKKVCVFPTDCHRNPSVETILWQKTNFNV